MPSALLLVSTTTDSTIRRFAHAAASCDTVAWVSSSWRATWLRRPAGSRLSSPCEEVHRAGMTGRRLRGTCWVAVFQVGFAHGTAIPAEPGAVRPERAALPGPPGAVPGRTEKELHVDVHSVIVGPVGFTDNALEVDRPLAHRSSRAAPIPRHRDPDLHDTGGPLALRPPLHGHVLPACQWIASMPSTAAPCATRSGAGSCGRARRRR